MENNKFKQFCSSIDYDTYYKLQTIFGFSSVGVSLTSDLMLSQYPILGSSFEVLTYLLFYLYCGLFFSRGKYYTKDFNQIRSLYQEFITNYNQLNEIFDFDNPIQIYVMYNYLLEKGYLSVNKKFEYLNQAEKDIKILYGADVIMGKGCCRHISAMLTDILNDYGIESSQLGVYSFRYGVNVKFLEYPKYTKEELIDWVQTHITAENTYMKMMEIIKNLVDEEGLSIELSTRITKDKNILKRKIGNHAITFSVKDGKSYYLDPTEVVIYRVNEEDKNILCDGKGNAISIKFLGSTILNDFSDYLKKEVLQQYPSVTREEEKKMIVKTTMDCKNNMDIFEKFYHENKDLYGDISDKMLKIKKKPFMGR